VSVGAFFGIWAAGGVVAFLWWYVTAWQAGSKDYSDLWQPALYSAIAWPFYLFSLVVQLPVLFLISKAIPDKPPPKDDRAD
jgi:hypothetical protein